MQNLMALFIVLFLLVSCESEKERKKRMRDARFKGEWAWLEEQKEKPPPFYPKECYKMYELLVADLKYNIQHFKNVPRMEVNKEKNPKMKRELNDLCRPLKSNEVQYSWTRYGNDPWVKQYCPNCSCKSDQFFLATFNYDKDNEFEIWRFDMKEETATVLHSDCLNKEMSETLKFSEIWEPYK